MTDIERRTAAMLAANACLRLWNIDITTLDKQVYDSIIAITSERLKVSVPDAAVAAVKELMTQAEQGGWTSLLVISALLRS